MQDDLFGGAYEPERPARKPRASKPVQPPVDPQEPTDEDMAEYALMQAMEQAYVEKRQVAGYRCIQKQSSLNYSKDSLLVGPWNEYNVLWIKPSLAACRLENGNVQIVHKHLVTRVCTLVELLEPTYLPA